MRIYIASSWRNEFQPKVVAFLRERGHEVYDFRNPPNGDVGFSWAEIDPNWKHWNLSDYVKALDTPQAWRGYLNDITALRECDLCVLVQPCGTSAHLELGHAAGAGKRTVVFFPDGLLVREAELMVKVADRIVSSYEELAECLKPSWGEVAKEAGL